MTTLVVAAHPDDEVLGCGGTMAALTDAGEEVHVVLLGEGATSRDDGASEVDALRRSSDAAAAVLGVASVSRFDLPDNRFDTVPMLEVAKLLEQVVDRLAPHTVYCQHGGDLNVDHQITFRATLTATRPMPGQPVREVLAFEVASSTEWAFQQFEPRFAPAVFHDVSATLDRKIDALLAYEQELRPFPHPRSVEGIRAVAVRWGAVVGTAAAEAFALVRSVR